MRSDVSVGLLPFRIPALLSINDYMQPMNSRYYGQYTQLVSGVELTRSLTLEPQTRLGPCFELS